MATEDVFETGDAAVVRRNPWITGLSAIPVSLGLSLAFVALITLSPLLLFFAASPILFGIALVRDVWRRNFSPRVANARLRADGSGLETQTETKTFLARAEIDDALILKPREGTPVVRIHRRGLRAPIDIGVPSDAAARSLVLALGLDAGHSSANFRLVSPAFAHPFRTVAAVVAAFGALGFLAPNDLRPALAFATLSTVAFLFLIPSYLTVGADGLVLRWLGKKRFVPHGEIKAIERFDRGFGLTWRVRGLDAVLESEEIVEINTGVDRPVIEERLREARRVHAGGAVTTASSALDREGRSIVDWMKQLRAVGAGANATHRTAPTAPETLWRVVEDPAGEPAARAAAAVALCAELDDHGRTRLRAAAEATAAPKLRVALNAAADAEEEVLALALADVEDTAAER